MSHFPSLRPLEVSAKFKASNSEGGGQPIGYPGEASVVAGKLTLPAYCRRDLEYLGTAGDISELVEKGN